MNEHSLDDIQLCGLIKSGAAEAFTELSKRYLWLIRAKAAAFKDAPVEREDLLQEGFLGLYSAAVSFSEDGGASFQTYAGLCVQRRMLSAVRKQTSGRDRAMRGHLSLDSDDAAEIAGGEDPVGTVEAREQLGEILSKLDSLLSPKEKEALKLYLSGCGRGEIEKRGMELKAYDNALARARKKLKNLTV